jgi:hypothetical protein
MRRGVGLAKYHDRKNAAVPKWVRSSVMIVAAIFAVAVFLALSGITGHHGQHFAHGLNMTDMPMPSAAKP